MNKKQLFLTTLLTGLTAAAVAPAHAQNDDGDAVIVTGSLISNANLERSAPVALLSDDEIELQQSFVVEEILREIPGTVPSIGAQVNNGNGGFSYVNLRGLGSNRNVVLFDGRRVAPSELNGRTDLNNIPIAVLDRIEVLTGGASTTYGADAIAGVVNAISDNKFSGIEINTSYGVTERGDGDTARIELTTGGEFDGGRGNGVVSFGYQKADPVFQGDREFSEFVHFYWDGSRGGSGLGPFNTRVGNVNPTGTDNGNLTLGGVQPDGTTFGAAFTPFNYAPFNVFQTPFEQYNIYTTADYQITDNVEAYTRAIFSRNTVDTIIAPSGAFGDSVTISLNHPFLSDAQRNAFCAFDTDPTAGVYTPLFTQAECDAAGAAIDPSDPNYREVDTQLRRRNVEGGPRNSEYRANYFDFAFGLRGDINENLNWDVMASYGQSDQIQTQKGYWLISRFRNALLAGPNGCFNDTANGCVPADYFGYTGAITPAMNAYLQGGESAITTRFDMAQIVGNLGGELNYSSPWADSNVNFALGAEWREYTGSRESDLLSQSGDLGGAGGAAPNIEGGFTVKEVLGELLIPLVEDASFAKSLNLEAGVRYSHYNVDAPSDPSYSATTWKVGSAWEPVDDIKVRGTFARAVRAPNIAELFSPVNTLLTNLSVDPCASVNDSGTNSGFVPTGALRDVCIAQGAPAGAIGFIPQPAAGQANYTGGGNVNLQPEKSDSFTLGVILQPEAVPGLTVTLDYYDISIEDAISAPTPQDAIDACFDNPSVSNPACLSIGRSPIDGGLSGDNAVVSGLPLFQSNTGNLATDGFDLTVGYKRDLGNVPWNSYFAANWTNSSTFQAVTGVSQNRDCVGLYSADCPSIQPEFSFNWRNTITIKDRFDLSLMWRYISGNEYEYRDIDTAFVGEPEGGVLGEWDFNETDPYHLFDLTGRFSVTDNLSLTLAVSNLFDKHPPLTGSFIGSTGYNSGNTYPSTFDTLGRRYKMSLKAKF